MITMKTPTPEATMPKLWSIDVNNGAVVEGPMTYEKAAALHRVMREMPSINDLWLRPALATDAHSRGLSQLAS